MKEEEKRNKAIINRLFSPDESVVLKTIVEIRTSGNPALIPAIIRQYRTTTSEHVREKILNLITDLKSQRATEPLVEELFRVEDNEARRKLISACWQSGLDFSAWLDPFLDSLLQDDYATALESFSVIENNLHSLGSEDLNRLNKKLKENIDNCSSGTRPLAEQLALILNDTLGE